jgi:glycosyltransferase involved in cell wall biosynthesis
VQHARLQEKPLSNVRISLVIPAYNRGDLIGDTIDSALAQDTPFHEIIVVDDGSTDATAAVLARYAGRIQAIALQNGGVQRARNTGAAAANGDYVALCDSDDLLEPGFVTAMGAWLAAHPDVDAVYTNFVTFNEDGIQDDKFALAPPGFFAGARQDDGFWCDIPDLYARLLDYQPLFPTGSVLRRDFYQRIRGYDTRFNRLGSEDLEFTLRAVAEGRMALSARPLARVRKHGANDSTDTMRQVSGEIEILEFALAHHGAAGRYRARIEASIEARRLDVFNAAFARGAFDVAGNMLARLRQAPRDRRFRLKALITRLPRPLRQPLWRASQA